MYSGVDKCLNNATGKSLLNALAMLIRHLKFLLFYKRLLLYAYTNLLQADTNVYSIFHVIYSKTSLKNQPKTKTTFF